MLPACRLGTQAAEHPRSHGCVHKRRKSLTERSFCNLLAVLILREFQLMPLYSQANALHDPTSPHPDALARRCTYAQCMYILSKAARKEAFVTTSAAAGKQQEIS